MIALNQAMKSVSGRANLLNVSDIALLTRVSGAVNILYGADSNESDEIPGYSNRQVAVANLITRSLTYLAELNTNVDIEDLLRKFTNLPNKY